MIDQTNNPVASFEELTDQGGVTIDAQLSRNIWNRVHSMYQSNDVAVLIMDRLLVSIMIDYITNRVHTDDDYARMIALRIQSIMNDLHIDVSKVGL